MLLALSSLHTKKVCVGAFFLSILSVYKYFTVEE